MYKKSVKYLLIIFCLSGCDQAKSNKPSLAISALPIFQQEITNMRSMYPGGPEVMSHICLFAGDEIDSGKFNKYATETVHSEKLERTKILKDWLESKVSKENLATVCAVYIISSLYTESNILGYFPSNEKNEFDKNNLKKITPVFLESIKLTASILSENKSHFESDADFRKKVREEITNRSYLFVKRIMKLNLDRYNFNSNGRDSGFIYSFNNGLTSLYLYGTPWFGNGSVMGEKYMFYINNE